MTKEPQYTKNLIKSSENNPLTGDSTPERIDLKNTREEGENERR